MRLPSVKTIRARLGVDEDVAWKVRVTLLEFGHRPAKCLREVDALIGGHGVEFLRSRHDTSRTIAGVEYVNMGRSYACTVLFDHATRRFFVESWSDFVERSPSRFGEKG